MSKYGSPWLTININVPALNTTIAARKEIMLGHDPIIKLFNRKSDATTVGELLAEADKFADDLNEDDFIEWFELPC